ncbi:DUF5696 domain-containing protein [Rossellomorea marisflavi]|uniref:DUF5696 domain-containing protein n=1 Tax=Rossellomorea marisflavi TaxID=189381 RepID=UPI0035188241
MYKKLFMALLVLIMAIPVIVFGNGNEVAQEETVNVAGTRLEVGSNQYTQPDGRDSPSVKSEDGSMEGYIKAMENDEMILYVHEKSLSLKVKDKRTGYMWKSGLDNPDRYRLNKTWEEFAQSAITLDYVDRRGKTKTESILTNQSKPQIRLTDDGFTASVYFIQSKINLTVEVKAEGDQLLVSIPDKKVKEGKKNQLLSMNVYPFLGAVNEDEVNGYMFIPDGSGALIRYQKGAKKVSTPYIQPIYGEDQGFTKAAADGGKGTTPPEEVTVPVFGAVHGVQQNGFLAVVENGYSFADIQAYPSGVATDVNWVGSKFHYRYEYYQPTSKSMNGINVYQKKRNPVDIKLRYMLLRDEEADYVGMARHYQAYLKKKNVLDEKKDEVAVRLEFLGSEVKKGLLWDSVLSMTPVTKLPDFMEELRRDGVDNMFMVYRGWSEGGLTGSLPAKFPVESKTGKKGEWKDTIKSLKDQDVPLYVHSDYTKAYEGAGGYAGRKDVANKISSETISHEANGYTSFFLTPEKSLEMAKKDQKEYKDLGMANHAVETTGNELFSDFNKKSASNRNETEDTYRDVFGTLKEGGGRLALYEPNVYAWEGLDKYLDIPMHSSNYMYVTDTVPFLQMVLKGYIPYYASFSNFNADQVDDLLRMVEYGANPSFYLTAESSTMLAKTPSKDLYTSEFSTWKSEIVHQYKLIEESLGQVEGAEITGRAVPEAGVVEVNYSNGKTIIVNYKQESFTKDGITVDAKGFEVVEGGAGS